MDEQALLEKLRKIEALMARPGSPGEGAAAAGARVRLLERLATTVKTDPPVEFRFTLSDQWSRHLFLALLRHYDLRPYRHRGQRYSTVMVRVSRSFVDETLWPEYLEMSTTLHGYLEDVTNRVICEIFHQKPAEAEEAPAQLAGPGGRAGRQRKICVSLRNDRATLPGARLADLRRGCQLHRPDGLGRGGIPHSIPSAKVVPSSPHEHCGFDCVIPANAYIYDCLIDARVCAGSYLRKIAGGLSPDAATALQRASDLYEQIVVRLRAGKPNVPFAWDLKGRAWTMEMRTAEARTLQDVLGLEQKAIAEIEQALARPAPQ